MMPIQVKPIPLKERSTYLTVEYGLLDVEDGAFVIRDVNGTRTKLPVGFITCLLLGPGTTITHAAVKLAADVRCLLIWVGENGVRQYSAGEPGGSRCDKLLTQAKAALVPELRMGIVRRMYQYRFEESFDELSIEQMRGKEAYRVKSIYHELSDKYGVEWNGRRYDPHNWRSADVINRCISSATSCLYGVAEASILIAGYSPAIGFIHTGRSRSFVYDIADLIKFETIIPVAFETAAGNPSDPERSVRHMCRDYFGEHHILDNLIELTNGLFENISVDVNGTVDAPAFSKNEGQSYDGLDM